MHEPLNDPLWQLGVADGASTPPSVISPKDIGQKVGMQAISPGLDYPLLIKNLLHRPMTTAAEQEITSGDSWRYDYVGFRERIGRLARGLASLGVGAGDTVAVMDWDSCRYLECYFAVPMMGVTLHTVNVRLSPEQILYTINHADDDIILVHADFAPILDAIKDRFERQVKIILLKDEPGTFPPALGHLGEYEELLASVDAGFDFPDFNEDTRATLFYTTGTTGAPKGVSYSHRQLVLHTLGLLAGFSPLSDSVRLHKNDVYMPMTPLFHVHGWGLPYAATLLGLKQVYPGRYNPAALLALIAREGVTFSHCVPTILKMLLDAPEAEGTDLTKLKVIIGGSALPIGLAKAAEAKGVSVFAAYGMSESCPFLTVADPSDIDDGGDAEASRAARCKSGKPGPLVEVRVVDQNMKDVPRDGQTSGEIVVRAPWLTAGYHKDPAATEELWRGGYLHTGDVGTIDATGVLQLTDRMKDVIKSGGEWISSLDLEAIASACKGVGEVAAIGLPDDRWGERPLLLVVRSLEAGTTVTADAIRAEIQRHVESGRISKWAIPDRIEFVSQLEKTSVGKLDKKALRARFGHGAAE